MKNKIQKQHILKTLIVIFVVFMIIFCMASCSIITEHETNTYEIDSAFDSIDVDVDVANVTFLPSDDGKCKVVCFEEPDNKHRVFVSDGTLHIESVDDDRIHFFNINLEPNTITVYLPKSEYVDLHIENDTGSVTVPKDFTFENIDISQDTGNAKIYASATGHINVEGDTGNILIEGVQAGSVNIENETGNITVTNLNCSGDIILGIDTGKTNVENTSCKNLYFKGSTGYIQIENLIASGKIEIENSTGDVRFSKMDATDIYINTNTGDINGSLLSGKMFTAETDTGKIRIPEDSTGGICKLTTDTGDIKITIED